MEKYNKVPQILRILIVKYSGNFFSHLEYLAKTIGLASSKQTSISDSSPSLEMYSSTSSIVNLYTSG